MRRFALALLLCLFAAPASASAQFEPNDSYNTAFGPLGAAQPYSAAFETSNDIDYYFFYLPQLTQMRYQLSAPASNKCSGYSASLEISQQLATYVDEKADLGVNKGETATGAITLDRGKYYVTIFRGCSSNSVGDRYTFQLDPAGATSTYEPFAAQCAAAHPPVESAVAAQTAKKAELTAARTRLSRSKTKLGRAHARSARRKRIRKLKTKVRAARVDTKRLRGELKTQNSAVSAAIQAENQACSVPE